MMPNRAPKSAAAKRKEEEWIAKSYNVGCVQCSWIRFFPNIGMPPCLRGERGDSWTFGYLKFHKKMSCAQLHNNSMIVFPFSQKMSFKRDEFCHWKTPPNIPKQGKYGVEKELWLPSLHGVWTKLHKLGWCRHAHSLLFGLWLLEWTWVVQIHKISACSNWRTSKSGKWLKQQKTLCR